MRNMGGATRVSLSMSQGSFSTMRSHEQIISQYLVSVVSFSFVRRSASLCRSSFCSHEKYMHVCIFNYLPRHADMSLSSRELDSLPL